MIEMINNSTLLQEIIFDSMKLFFIIGAISGVIIGLFLIYKPDSFKKWNQKLNHWYSSRKTLKPLEIMHETDSHVYKHNKYWGGAMLIGSGLFLYHYFTWQFPETALKLLFPNQAESFVAEATMSSIWMFLAVFILMGIPVWVLLIINPDLLKRVSKLFNHWYSTRLALLPLVKMHHEFDKMVVKNNRVFGILFIFGSIYILYTVMYYNKLF